MGQVLATWRSSSLKVLLSGEEKGWQIDRQIGAASAVMQTQLPVCHGKDWADPKVEAIDLLLNVNSFPDHLP